MPPFDPFFGEPMLDVLKRLADERDQSWRRTRKGDKRPAYDIEASKQGRLRNIKAKQLAATERTLAAARKRNSTRPAKGTDIQSRILKAMVPMAWYGREDLVRMVGADRNGRNKVNDMLKRGWLEAARNPAWGGRNLNPQEIMGGAEPEPERLYRLTTSGLARRAALE